MSDGPVMTLDRALAQYDRLQGFFPRVEARAGFLFTLNLALAGITVINLPAVRLCFCEIALAALAGGAIAAALGCSLMVFTSHLRNAGSRSLLFFGDIACYAVEEYRAAALQASAIDLLNDALDQVWRNGEILTWKFRWVGRAFKATVLAIPAWLLLLGVIAIHTGKLPLLKLG